MTSHHPVANPVTRRSVLRAAALGTVAAPLVGCVPPSADVEGADAPTSGARSGGVLRVVALGGTTAAISPLSPVDLVGYLATYHLYDSIAILLATSTRLQLATAVEPDPSGTQWTITVRQGVTFHDGRPLTSADVAYSLRTLADPQRSPIFASYYADVLPEQVTTPDDSTVVVSLRRPRGDFLDAVLSQVSPVFPDGTSDGQWGAGIGTGPFAMDRVDGGSVVLQANPEYWDGAPLLDSLVVAPVTDPAARLAAVTGGQADYAVDIGFTAGRRLAQGGPVVVDTAPASGAMTFLMNTHAAPFDDPTVVEAFKLLMDRQQLVDTVLAGSGTVGNDVVGWGLAGYDTALPQRTRDVQRARDLLSAAGVSQVTMVVAETTAGLLDAARLMVQQAAEAGLTITLDQRSPETYYADLSAVLTTPLQAGFWKNRPPLVHAASYTGSRGGFNITALASAEYDALLDSAQAAVDDDERAALANQVQQYLWQHDGQALWGFADQVSATVNGLTPTAVFQSVPVFHASSLPQ